MGAWGVSVQHGPRGGRFVGAWGRGRWPASGGLMRDLDVLRPKVQIALSVHLYEKRNLLMVYTVFTGGPAFSSFSFVNVFSRCLLDGSFLRLLEGIW